MFIYLVRSLLPLITLADSKIHDALNCIFTIFAANFSGKMSLTGIIIGLATFLIIGVFHPIVIKAEYYLGTKCWWIFLLLGIAFCVLSLFVGNLIISTIAGVVGFSSFWSILELIHQKERVRKGWFPKGPGHRE